MTTYLDIDELATFLGRSVRSVKRDMGRSPTSVPPKMHIPGSALLRWRAHEVQNWIVETSYSSGASCGQLEKPKNGL